MAQPRKFGMMWCRWFDDPDFLDRSPEQRWMYAFLRAQSDLSKAGVIIIRPALWAEGTGFPEQTVLQLLEQLEAEGYVAIDQHTSELLVCGYIYDDEIYLEPYKLRNACDVARGVKSKAIKSLLYAEAKAVIVELTGPSAGRKGADRSADVCEEMIYALEPFANLRLATRMPFGVPMAPADMPVGARATARQAASGEAADRVREGSGDPFQDPIDNPPERVRPAGQNGQKRVSAGFAEGSQCLDTPNTTTPNTKNQTFTPPAGGAQDEAGLALFADPRPPEPEKPKGVQDVVGEYVQGAMDAKLDPLPSQALRNRVGKRANYLLHKEHVPVDRLMTAAYNMGAAGWDDLDRQLQREAVAAQPAPAGAGSVPQQRGQGGRSYVPDMTEIPAVMR
jgi:hypothetical protein